MKFAPENIEIDDKKLKPTIGLCSVLFHKNP